MKWTDELRIYGEGFVGRRDELAALDQAWGAGARIFALHAEGGAGKTRVVVKWLTEMRDAGWRGARRVFVHSFYSQGSDERRNASSELFFEQALAFFGYRGEPITQADERGRTLARLLLECRGLLVLDGLEPLQQPTNHVEKGRLKDLGIERLLLSLANASPDRRHGLCLITSRQPVIEIQNRTGVTVLQTSLNQLHRDDGAVLLKEFAVIGSDEDLKKASDEFHGHAYSLMLLGSFLRNATEHHDIRRRAEVVLLGEDATTQHPGHARRMFAAYVRYLSEDSPEVAVLRLLGFFDRAAEREILDVLRAREGVVYEWSEQDKPADRRAQPKRIEDSLFEVTAPLLDLSQPQWHRVLNRLRDLRLIYSDGPDKSSSLDAHPLLREFFAEQLQARFPKAWESGHRRLFEHLGGTAPYWPEGIEGLQPLYQAVAHGCLAGLHEQAFADVYYSRILRGTGAGGFYSIGELGVIDADIGALACFFVVPWTTLAPSLAPAYQAWLLNEAATRLHALGRLTEAVKPMRMALAEAIRQENWDEANVASNLSGLEISRGEISAAVTAGEQSVTYADRRGQNLWQMVSRTTLAAALHQAGRRGESQRLFREAKEFTNDSQLYLRSGFHHCDLLLSDAERAGWQAFLTSKTGRVGEHLRDSLGNHGKSTSGRNVYSGVCDSVSNQATCSLQLVERNVYPLTIGLDHLTLARAELYRLLSISATSYIAFDHITAAIKNLRASGFADHLPLGLLTRAWMLSLSGDDPGARTDLDEAWDIAERGPMPLFQADIQLTRARLFRDRVALEEARRLIEKHGYHRRDGELADAMQAAQGW